MNEKDQASPAPLKTDEEPFTTANHRKEQKRPRFALGQQQPGFELVSACLLAVWVLVHTGIPASSRHQMAISHLLARPVRTC